MNILVNKSVNHHYSILAVLALLFMQPKTDAQHAARHTHKDSMSLQWIGGPTFILTIGPFRFLSDPMFSKKGDSAFILPRHPSTNLPNAPISRHTALPLFKVEPLTAVLLSHIHADHFDQQAKAALPRSLLIIGPSGIQKNLAEDQFTNITTLDWGKEYVFAKDSARVVIKAVKADHSHNKELNAALGKVNGYIIRYTNGKGAYTIYWTGDTVWPIDSLNNQARLPKIDLLIPHLGAVGKHSPQGARSMDATQAIELIHFLKPKLVIPVHHTTFSHYTEPITDLQQKLKDQELHSLKVLQPGETALLGY